MIHDLDRQNEVVELGNSFNNFLGDFDFFKLLFVLRKCLYWFLLIIIISILLTFSFFRYSQPIYEATTLIKIDYKSSSELLKLELDNFKEGIDAINLAGEIELLSSKIVYQAVINSVDLDISYYAKGKMLNSEYFGTSPFIVNYNKKKFSLYDIYIHVEMLNENSFLLRYDTPAGCKYSRRIYIQF